MYEWPNDVTERINTFFSCPVSCQYSLLKHVGCVLSSSDTPGTRSGRRLPPGSTAAAQHPTGTFCLLLGSQTWDLLLTLCWLSLISDCEELFHQKQKSEME